MSVTLVPEDDLRAALRPYRVDPVTFESAVRARVSDGLSHTDDPLATLSPAPRSAAAFLPLEVIAAGQMPAAALKLVPGMGAFKLLSYVAFPAISLFVLLGATVFSILKIRRIRDENSPAPVDEKALLDSTRRWWHDNKWGVWLVFASKPRHGVVRRDLAALPVLHRFSRTLDLRLDQPRQDRPGKSTDGRPILCDRSGPCSGNLRGLQGSATRTFTLSIRP